MFHKEGYQIILTSFLIAALIAIGSEYKIDNFILRTVFQIFSLLINKVYYLNSNLNYQEFPCRLFLPFQRLN